MTKRPLLTAMLSGLVFAVGLGVAGMTRPSKVIGFLDVANGHWDPSLAFVMIGAIGIHLPFYRWFRARATAVPSVESCGPIELGSDSSPTTRIDGRLLLGAAIFGVGWGLGGYCPGPAVVSVASGAPGALIFFAAMLVGMSLAPSAGARSESTLTDTHPTAGASGLRQSEPSET